MFVRLLQFAILSIAATACLKGKFQLHDSRCEAGHARHKSGLCAGAEHTPLASTAGVVGTPVASPAAGVYNLAQSVVLSSATEAASIYYTTDGSTPTPESTLYSAPISIAASQTIKAIGVKAGQTTSEVASFAYEIKAPSPSAAEPCQYSLASEGVPAANNLQAYFSFEDSVVDLSGNGRDASRLNGAAYASAWPALGAGSLSLDGVDQWVSVPYDINPVVDLTVAQWIKFDQADNNMVLFSNDDGDFDRGLGWAATSPGADWYVHVGTENQVVSETGVAVPAVGAWHHVAMVYSSSDMRMYVNGQLAWSDNSPAAHNMSGDNYVGIGRSNWQGGGDGHSYFKGLMDEFAVWDTALTGPQVSEIFERQNACLNPQP